MPLGAGPPCVRGSPSSVPTGWWRLTAAAVASLIALVALMAIYPHLFLDPSWPFGTLHEPARFNDGHAYWWYLPRRFFTDELPVVALLFLASSYVDARLLVDDPDAGCRWRS